MGETRQGEADLGLRRGADEDLVFVEGKREASPGAGTTEDLEEGWGVVVGDDIADDGAKFGGGVGGGEVGKLRGVGEIERKSEFDGEVAKTQ